MRSLPSFRRATALSPALLAFLGLQLFAANVHAQSTFREVEPCSVESAAGGVSSAIASDKLPAGLETTDWSSIRAAYGANRHTVLAVEDGYQARNPGQHWLIHFDRRGMSTRPDAGGWSWGLQLERYGFAGHERAVCEPVQVSAHGERVAYDWDATLQEWWVNDARGLEHGYTVRERPLQCEEGPLTFTLAVHGGLLPRLSDDGRDVHFSNAGGVEVLMYTGLVVLDADGQTLGARFARTGASQLRLSIEERGARYPLTIDPLVQQTFFNAYFKASNTDATDAFGGSVSMSGDTVVVAAAYESSGASGVNGNQGDNSAPASGAAYVFVRSGGSWVQQAYLKASNTGEQDIFGTSVSVSGDTVVVGAILEESIATGVNGNQSDNSAPRAGAAYVFARNGTTWSQQAYLKASNTETFDKFGASVSVSGDRLVVAAPGESSNATGVNGNEADNSATGAGAVYVFARSGTTWSQEAYLKASNSGAYDAFGCSVSMSGDTVVVGAYLEASNATGVNGNENDDSAYRSGAAYVFVRNGTTWSQQAYLKASNTEAFDQFGRSVSVSGDRVVVGALDESSNATGVNGNEADNSALRAGAAYVFARSGTTWSQEAYLKASNSEAEDSFGCSVSMSGDRLVVGAQWEDSNATGVNGDENDNSASGSGAAHVFVRNGTSWSQESYLKASNTDALDRFGVTVSVSGDRMVVGALREASNATGVNGNQLDNSAFFAGAAYVFGPHPAAFFCVGDGSGAPCPCGNLGDDDGGCNNSAGTGGALLTFAGSPSPDTIVFTSTRELPTALSIFLQGTVNIGNGVSFGDGVRCVAGLLKRLYTKNASGGTASAPTGSDPSVSTQSAALGDTIAPGSTRFYQVYYRDPNLAFCPAPLGNSWNVSNGIQIVW